MNTNQNDFKQTCIKSASQYRTLSFGRKEEAKMSSVGVYMLAVKVIRLAKRLKEEGKNVMLVVDNIQEILANEWTVLQNLKLPVSTFSLLNELYSICSDGSLQSSDPKKKNGSITAITITSSQDQDVIQ